MQKRQLSLDLPAGARRRADRASDDEERLVWILLQFVRRRRVTLADWIGAYGRSIRTFERDVAKVRELGERFGFVVAPRRAGVVRLSSIAGLPDPAKPVEGIARETLAAVVDALGDVIARSVAGAFDARGGPADGFLRFAVPRLIAGTAVADTYDALRDAWSRRAAVRFRYPTRDGAGPAERVVEPYAVTYNAGRYYLVGYDGRGTRGGWRQFALDRIAGPIVRAHTFTPKAIPARYRGLDAIGLFKHDVGAHSAPAAYVTIALSPLIAEAVTGRRWQADQRVERSGHRVTIAFLVHDLGEAVRWAFGFGAEARVIAPPRAVDLARTLASEVLAGYAPSQRPPLVDETASA